MRHAQEIHLWLTLLRWAFIVSWFVFVATVVWIARSLKRAIHAAQVNAQNIAEQRSVLNEITQLLPGMATRQAELADTIAIIGARAPRLDALLEHLQAQGQADEPNGG